MSFRKEQVGKNLEVTVAENTTWWEWDLWLNRGAGFAVYLVAFGKAESEEEAIKNGRDHAKYVAGK